jgi:hypothetical protein
MSPALAPATTNAGTAVNTALMAPKRAVKPAFRELSPSAVMFPLPASAATLPDSEDSRMFPSASTDTSRPRGTWMS